MHYIPFLSESPRNRYEDVDCRNCPCFEGSIVYDKVLVGTCRFNRGQKEQFDLGDLKTVTLKGAQYRDCPVQYRDPVELFHYFQFMSIVSNEFVATCKKLEDKGITEEERDYLEDRRDKNIQLYKLMKELFPKFDDLYNKIHDGYVLDEHMEPYKLGSK